MHFHKTKQKALHTQKVNNDILSPRLSPLSSKYTHTRTEREREREREKEREREREREREEVSQRVRQMRYGTHRNIHRDSQVH